MALPSGVLTPLPCVSIGRAVRKDGWTPYLLPREATRVMDDDIDRAKFAAWLRRTRLAKGYRSQSDLAEASGVSVNTISNLETGKTRPLPGTVAALRETLGEEPVSRVASRDVDEGVEEVVDIIRERLMMIRDPELRQSEVRALFRFLVMRGGNIES